MTSGKNHDRITRTISIGVVVAGEVLGFGAVSLMAGAGAAMGLYLSPDLDLPRCNARKRWTSLRLGWIWTPYEKLLAHRSFWSHFPIVGTVGRLAYVGWPLLLWGYDPLTLYWEWTAAFALGLALADIGHWVADGFPLG